MNIHYIGEDENVNGQAFQSLTAQAKLATNATLKTPNVQPGQLDILMIPGPPPGLKMSAETSHFVQQHAGHGTIILTICTGCFVAAQAGILDGLNASGPRALVPSLRKGYPKVVWDDKHRWVKSVSNHGKGEIWSSGMFDLLMIVHGDLWH